ncbi:MAG: SMC-Scp complex subunit ScpB [Thermoplasmata archaeon]
MCFSGDEETNKKNTTESNESNNKDNLSLAPADSSSETSATPPATNAPMIPGGIPQDISPVLVIEAVLFSAGKPLTVSDISEATGYPLSVIRESLKALIAGYRKKNTALEVSKSEDRYLIRVKDNIAPYTSRLAKLEVPRHFLKTLAVIAYEQPVPQKWVIETLGDKAATHIKELDTMGFIQRKRQGRGFILSTTKKFAAYFGLESNDPESIRNYLATRVGLPYNPNQRKLEDTRKENGHQDTSPAGSAEACSADDNKIDSGEQKTT